MKSLKKRLRLAAILLVSASAVAVAMPKANAFETVVIGTRHFVHCFGLMIGKPDVHAQQCLPNNVHTEYGSISSMTGSAGDPVVAEEEPEEPVEEPEEPVEEPEEPVEEPEQPAQDEPPVQAVDASLAVVGQFDFA
ncbi:hypothetical protein [Devosia sp. 2618]|uniref:hypothetical protein n=1 Tax=Devosia sp. 2618 TaxID=3156454 RepID=UPI00339961C7